MGSLRLSSSTEAVNESCLTLRMKNWPDELCLLVSETVVSIKLSFSFCDRLTRSYQAARLINLTFSFVI